MVASFRELSEHRGWASMAASLNVYGTMSSKAASVRNRGFEHRRARDFSTLIQSKEVSWRRLCASYLPVVPHDSIWRFSRPLSPADPEQGWKIHVSATILSAHKILKRIAPFLHELNVLFKAASSLSKLKELNCGLYAGFSQVGKCITVYPRNPEEAVFIARRLHKLTYKLPGPVIPYDIPLRENSCVYYRYGSFSSLEIKNPDGTSTPGIRDPEGRIVPDVREYGAAFPTWVHDPFSGGRRKSARKRAADSPLSTTIRAYEALMQRGKGGVYKALDLSVSPARLCILKEGRRNGETDIDGRDVSWRVRYEARVLRALHAAGITVPEVYTEFEAEGNYYITMEWVEGQNLHSLLTRSKKKLHIALALRLGARLASLLAAIHSAGWVWRDCKPLNLLQTEDGNLRPLDFEGACLSSRLEVTPWGTPGYTPPEWLKEPASGSRLPEDLYALGASLHQLLSGLTPSALSPRPIGTLRRGIPRAVREVVMALLDPTPQSRPGADEVLKVLEAYPLPNESTPAQRER